MSSSWIPLAQLFSVVCLLAVVCYQWLSRRPSRRRGGDGGSSGDWFGSDRSGHHAHSGGWDSGVQGDNGGGGDGGGDGGGGGD